MKIGFLIPLSKKIPAWYKETIEQTIAIPDVEVHFIITDHAIVENNKKTSLFYRLFKKFEAWWFQSEFDAGKLVSVENMIAEHNTIILSEHHFLFLSENSLGELLQKELDILYTCFLDTTQKDNISKAARLGLWHIQIGYEKYRNIFPIAFYEVMEDSPAIGSYLLARKNDEDFLIHEGTTITIPYSVQNTFNSIAWRSASYLPHGIKGLLLSSVSSPFQKPILSNPQQKMPGNFKMLFLFTRNVFRYVVYKIKNQRDDHFTLLLSPDSFELNKNLSFQSIQPPKDSFYADPFVIEGDFINYIFFEEFVFAQNKAHISVVEVKENNIVSPPKVVLDKPYHLSYPFIFLHNNEYYMVPETSCNNTVELYKARNFPGDWEFVMNLVTGKALIDVTLHFENGFWWMFANSSDHPFTSTNDQLFLFYSKELFSDQWTPHPQNPVVTHVENCRPAGRIFRQNGKLYRPAQNNASKQYGHGLKINEIVVLNEKEYREKEVFSFDTNKQGLKACHHIDFTNSLTVIDGILK